MFVARFVFFVLNHHWSAADKKSPSFVAKYPYCASIRDMLIWLLHKDRCDLRGRHIVMDSYFANVDTFRILRTEYDVDATGTIKVPAGAVPKEALWPKSYKGAFGDTRVLVTRDDVVIVVQWIGKHACHLRHSFHDLCCALRPCVLCCGVSGLAGSMRVCALLQC